MTYRGLAGLVTDHALVRYIERVYGVNMDRIREEILTAPVMAEIGAQNHDTIHSAHAPSSNGMTAVIRTAKVVTVLRDKGEGA